MSVITSVTFSDQLSVPRVDSLVPVNQDDQDEGWDIANNHRTTRRNRNWAKTIYDHTRWCWVLLALASLVLQATRQVDISPTHLDIMFYGELGITIAFDVEIIIRIIAALPDWRSFWISGRNVLDLGLAIGCSVIQIPVIRENDVYEWFTILQLARFYRVILEIPRMKPLLVSFAHISYLIIFSMSPLAGGVRKPLWSG